MNGSDFFFFEFTFAAFYQSASAPFSSPDSTQQKLSLEVRLRVGDAILHQYQARTYNHS